MNDQDLGAAATEGHLIPGNLATERLSDSLPEECCRSNKTSLVIRALTLWSEIKEMIKDQPKADSPVYLCSMLVADGKIRQLQERITTYINTVVDETDSSPDERDLSYSFFYLQAVYYQCLIFLYASLIPIFSCQQQGEKNDDAVPLSMLETSIRTVLTAATQFTFMLLDFLATKPDVTRIPPFIGYCTFAVGLVHSTLNSLSPSLPVADAHCQHMQVALLLLDELIIYWPILTPLRERIVRGSNSTTESSPSLQSLIGRLPAELPDRTSSIERICKTGLLTLMNGSYRHTIRQHPRSRTTESVPSAPPAEQGLPRLLGIPFIPFPTTPVEGEEECPRSPSPLGFDRKKKDKLGVSTHHNFITKNLQLHRASFHQERNSSLDAGDDFNHLSCSSISDDAASSAERHDRNFSLPSSVSTSLPGLPGAGTNIDLSITAHLQPGLEPVLHPSDQSYDIESEQSHMNWFGVPGAELLSMPELNESYRGMAGGRGFGDLWQ
ncbi:hypothetical protein AYO22_05451 [Fonsecaea multimorphosa]|nr:hypothetical protein AYO22_05451 [Fonsecaea multimorphosa]